VDQTGVDHQGGAKSLTFNVPVVFLALNNTQQHTTTLHNSNRVHKTTNVPVVFMARYVMILRGATSLLGALEGVGPENGDFFGPEKVLSRLNSGSETPASEIHSNPTTLSVPFSLQ
jgi:hypothetical protein